MPTLQEMVEQYSTEPRATRREPQTVPVRSIGSGSKRMAAL
jgi:hypothetical protein